MAESVDINLVNNEPNVDSWSLGCDIIIEEADTDIQEIRLRDIGLIGDIYTGEVPVEINPDLVNVMDLDVNVTIDGVNPNIVESQVVTYDKILKITDYSPETTNETRYAASARSVKALHAEVEGIERRVNIIEGTNVEGGLNEEMLQEYLDANKYIKEDFLEANNYINEDYLKEKKYITEEVLGKKVEEKIGEMFYWDDDEHTIIGTDHHLYSKGEISANGLNYGSGGSVEPGGGASLLKDLLDVNIQNPNKDDVLLYNGTHWQNSKLNITEQLSSYLKIDDAKTTYATIEELNDLKERVDSIKEDEFFFKHDDNTIGTRYNIFSEKEISANGLNLGGGGSGSGGSTTLDGLIDVNLSSPQNGNILVFNGTHWVNKPQSELVPEVDLSDYYTKQQTQNAITSALSPYIKATDADGKYAALASFNALQSSFDRLYSALNDDTSGVINTWNEVVDFVNEYSGSEDLSTILGKMNTDINARVKVSDFDTWKTDVFNPLSVTVTNLGNKVNDHTDKINKILSWFELREDEDLLITTHNLASYKEISANGISQGTGGGGSGLISSVLGVGSLGATLTNDNSVVFNAYATNEIYKATQGHASRIGVLESQVGQLTTQGTKVSVSDLLTTGTKIATITVDGVAHEVKGDFLPTSGGILTGRLTIKGSSWASQLVINGVGTQSGINFQEDGGSLGLLHVNGLKQLRWYVDAKNYEVLHSGNYSQYALPTSGGTISGSERRLLTMDSSDWYGPMLSIKVRGEEKGIIGHIPSTTDSKFGLFISNIDANTALLLASDRELYFSLDSENLAKTYKVLHSGNVGDYAFVPRTVVTNNTDANTLLTNGVYINSTGNGIGNINFPHGYGMFMSFAKNDDYIAQIALGTSSMYARTKFGTSGWSDWKQIAFTSNLENYLPLTGGTISGNITVDRYYFGDKNHVGYGYLTVDDSVNSRVYYVDNLGTYNILLHSGNVGEYAVKIDGSSRMKAEKGLKWDSFEGGNSDNFDSSFFVGRDASADSTLATSKRPYTAVLNVGGNAVSGYRFQLASYVGPTHNELYYRGYNNNGSEWKDWKTIAFTDSNVASADYAKDAGILSDFYGVRTASANIGAFGDGKVRKIIVSSSMTEGKPPFDGSILHFSWDSKFGFEHQLHIANNYTATANQRMSWRAQADGVWGEWKSVAFTDSNVASAQALVHSNGNVVLYTTSGNMLRDGNGRVIMDYGDDWQCFGDWTGSGTAIRGSEIRFEVDGNKHLLINSSGNVGIGTTSPQTKLHVSGTWKSFDNLVTFEKNDSYDSRVVIKNSIESLLLAVNNAGNAYLSVGGQHSLVFETNNTARMLINSHGNVTIGADNFATGVWKLYIHGKTFVYGQSTRPSLGAMPERCFTVGYSSNEYVHYGLNTWIESSGNAFMQVGRTDGTATAYNLVLNPLGGNVLIGTTTDSGEKLQVKGLMKATSVTTESVELYHATPFIDFHFNNSTADFTSRIIETSSGVLNINAALYALFKGNVGVGTNKPAYTLDVNGTLRATNAVTFDSTLTIAGATTHNGIAYFGGTTYYINTSGNANFNAISGSSLQVASLSNGGLLETSTLRVSSTSTFTGKTNHNGGIGATSLNVSGTSTLSGHVGIGASSHDDYSLYISGPSYMTGDLTVNGTLYADDIEGSNIYVKTSYNLYLHASGYVGTYNGRWAIDGYGNYKGQSLYINPRDNDNVTNPYDKNKGFPDDEVAVFVNGDIAATGEISANALNQGSDIRFKHQLGDIALDLDTIANAPMFRFTWTNKENSRVQIGTSAQYWKDSARELVSVDKDDFHRLDYATLGVLIGVTLGKTVKNHEDRIKELETKVESLEEENRRLRYEC